MLIFISKYSKAVGEALNSIAHCCYITPLLVFLRIAKIAKENGLIIIILQRLQLSERAKTSALVRFKRGF